MHAVPIHFFSAEAGQGSGVDIDSGAGIESAHHFKISKAADEIRLKWQDYPLKILCHSRRREMNEGNAKDSGMFRNAAVLDTGNERDDLSINASVTCRGYQIRCS